MNRFNFAFAPPAAALHAPPPAQPDAIDLAGPAAWCADIPFRGESAPLPLKSTQLPYRATNMTNVLRRLEPFTHPRDGTPLELAPIDPAVVATPFTTVMYGMPEVCVDARNARDWVMGEAAAAGFEGAEPMFVGGEKAKYGGKTGELMLGYAVVGFETRRAARDFVRAASFPGRDGRGVIFAESVRTGPRWQLSHLNVDDPDGYEALALHRQRPVDPTGAVPLLGPFSPKIPVIPLFRPPTLLPSSALLCPSFAPLFPSSASLFSSQPPPIADPAAMYTSSAEESIQPPTDAWAPPYLATDNVAPSMPQADASSPCDSHNNAAPSPDFPIRHDAPPPTRSVSPDPAPWFTPDPAKTRADSPPITPPASPVVSIRRYDPTQGKRHSLDDAEVRRQQLGCAQAGEEERLDERRRVSLAG